MTALSGLHDSDGIGFNQAPHAVIRSRDRRPIWTPVGVTRARLAQDRLLRHAVERVLAQLVELVNSHIAVSLPGTAATTHRQSFPDAGRTG